MDDKNNSNLLTIGVSGFISSLAFIMPGISGSMLLLVLGVYDIIIVSMSDVFNMYSMGMKYESLVICIIFGFFFIVGVVFFSKIIKKVLASQEHNFLILSFGLLIGMICVMSVELLNSGVNIFLIILISGIGVLTIKFLGE
jgi:putative membrane protein